MTSQRENRTIAILRREAVEGQPPGVRRYCLSQVTRNVPHGYHEVAECSTPIPTRVSIRKALVSALVVTERSIVESLLRFYHRTATAEIHCRTDEPEWVFTFYVQ